MRDDTYIFHQTYIHDNTSIQTIQFEHSSLYDRFKENYHIHMNDEHFEEVSNRLPYTKVAKVIKIDEISQRSNKWSKLEKRLAKSLNMGNL